MAERERVENKVNIKIKHLFDHQEKAINETIKSIKSYLDLDELNYYNHKHFAIEMETGTGKTFTFINTIFQLYNNFADKENPDDLRFKKFIILVPRIAIREGIANTFYDFENYFKTQYNNLQYEVDAYQDGDVSTISNFLDGNDLRILILTKQSFDSKNKILHQNNDYSFGRGTYINQMQATHPVVIIDEPQLNKGFNTNEMIDLLKPSFVLSYSATPPKVIEKDIIYKYTPEQAYNDRQVKRLEYYSITIGNSINATIELKKIKDKKAEILYNGVKECTLKAGDNFGEKVGDNSLKDYFVGNIRNDEVFFTNQTKLSDLIAKSVNQEDLLRAEINETIKQHKNKNETLKKQNIKQLSLFFAPRVADFITSKEGEIGIVQTIFKEEYKKVYGVEIKNEQFAYYFSEKDNINEEQQKEMTRMILKEKNKLISLDNPVEFIFAHTSLGVGWDNPNIFNICFLRNIPSDKNKKQFVGRGLRLCVNQKGERVFEDKDIKDTDRLNNLTIIGSLQYENFCKQYQKDAGWNSAQNQIGDATQKRKVNKISIIDDEYTEQRQAFAQELWRALRPKTNWYIYFNKKQELFDKIKKNLQEINVDDRRITIIGGDISGNQNEYNTTKIRQEYNENKLIKDLASENWLTLHEIKKLLDGVDREKIKKNQADWSIKAKEIIRNEIESEVLGLDNVEVKYSKIESVNQENSNFDLKSFEEEDFETTADTEATEAKNENYNNSLYNEVPCDSGPEHSFVRSANANNNIKLFVKLPKQTENSKKFHINTPFGSYTPDFAILTNNENNKLYLVLEVKDQTISDLRRSFPEQWFKIKCAMKHFEVLGFGDCASIEENCANMFNMSKVLEQINREDNKGKDKFYGVYVPKEKKKK